MKLLSCPQPPGDAWDGKPRAIVVIAKLEQHTNQTYLRGMFYGFGLGVLFVAALILLYGCKSYPDSDPTWFQNN